VELLESGVRDREKMTIYAQVFGDMAGIRLKASQLVGLLLINNYQSSGFTRAFIESCYPSRVVSLWVSWSFGTGHSAPATKTTMQIA
jgi:hypothetical protein